MKDYYAILHVLPSAEIDVIKAAYKALARKYHPDTFDGDKAYASKRMQEINDAFGVIGDPDKRKKYDAERKATNQEDEFTSNGEENDARLEEDWKVATKYCPDAESCFAHLNKLSRSLAFAFKSYLLDSKQFSECDTIGDKFRAEFLNNYFGSNPAIQDIGEKLVLSGELAAAKTVNRAVKVMGKSLRIDQLTKTLQSDFPHLSKTQEVKFSHDSKASKLFLRIKDSMESGLDHPSLLLCEEFLNELSIPYRRRMFLGIWGYYSISYLETTRKVFSTELPEWIINFLGKQLNFKHT